eukprot:scaffold75012_cov43-Attheya_sp.AAC.3
MMKNLGSNCLGVLLLVVLSSEAFVVPVSRSVQTTTAVHVPFTTSLFAANDGKKKKRRRKKDSTVLPPPPTAAVEAPAVDN